MQFGLKSKLGGFCEEDAFRLSLTMGNQPKWRYLKHDACSDVLLDSAVASNLVACREPERYFECHNGTDLTLIRGLLSLQLYVHMYAKLPLDAG